MEEDSTISDKIDGMIFPLPLEDKIKCWELIEELIIERIREAKIKNFLEIKLRIHKKGQTKKKQ